MRSARNFNFSLVEEICGSLIRSNGGRAHRPDYLITLGTLQLVFELNLRSSRIAHCWPLETLQTTCTNQSPNNSTS